MWSDYQEKTAEKTSREIESDPLKKLRATTLIININ